MKGQGHIFAGVDVGLPSKVQGSEAEDEWQEVAWVSWSVGELSVDSDAFLLVFKPTGGNVKAKPLGALLKATPVDHSEDGRTLMVTTNDPVSKLYRLTFKSQADAVAFTKVAQLAEESAGLGEEDTVAGQEARRAEQAKLEAEIREALTGKGEKAPPPALIFGGGELCGPDPGNPSGGEVLLASGAAVLLDPPDDGTVGTWHLLFYNVDDGGRKATATFPLGPTTKLRRQKGGAADPDGPAATFTLTLGPRGTAAEKAHTISFDDAQVADAFARDFRVRQRVMELAGKHVKGQQNANDLLGEIRDLKRKTLCARVAQLVGLILMVVLIASVVRVAMLYKEDKGARKPAEYVKALVKDAFGATQVLGKHVTQVGSKACHMAFKTVPAVDLQRCLGLDSGVRTCVEKVLR